MIVVGGEALVDLVDDGVSRRAIAGGGPFNTAVALGRLGLPVAFLGAVSRDAYGQILGQLLADAGVDTSLVGRSDLPTPRATVHRESDGRNTYTFSLAATAFTDVSVDRLPPLPADVWAIHVGTLALAVDPPAAAYEALLDREAGARRIILDPNVRPEIFGDVAGYRRRFERLAGLADIVKLSADDASWIYPGLPLPDVSALILGLGPRLVALTCGANGAVARSGSATVAVPGMRVLVADSVGAGDSFGAALIAALIDEGAFGPAVEGEIAENVLRRALTYAVAASAVTCTRTGAVPPTRVEVAAQLSAFSDGCAEAAPMQAPAAPIATSRPVDLPAVE